MRGKSVAAGVGALVGAIVLILVIVAAYRGLRARPNGGSGGSGGPPPKAERPWVIVHYMLWWLTGDGDAPHWCGLMYAPQAGMYAGTDPAKNKATLSRQIGQMKAANIDGMAINYHSAAWNGSLQQVVEACEEHEFLYYIDPDSAEQPFDALLSAQNFSFLRSFFGNKHYFWLKGKPVLQLWSVKPPWNGPMTPTVRGACTVIWNWFTWYGDPNRPSGFDGTASWHGPTSEQKTFYAKFQKGGAFADQLCFGNASAGWYPGYVTAGDTHYTNDIVEQLQLGIDNRADVIVLTTWNDYGEGTHIEPSYIRPPDEKTPPPCPYPQSWASASAWWRGARKCSNFQDRLVCDPQRPFCASRLPGGGCSLEWSPGAQTGGQAPPAPGAILARVGAFLSNYAPPRPQRRPAAVRGRPPGAPRTPTPL